jgi:MFS family permease
MPSSSKKPLRLILASAAISGIGDGVFVSAFPLLAASLTREPVLIAGVTVALQIPWMTVAFLAGATADRRDRVGMLVTADLARAAIVGVLGVVLLLMEPSIWVIYICALCLGSAETFHAAAAQAFLPTVVEPRDLVSANARVASTGLITNRFAGPPLGAALFAASRSMPFLVDAVSFVAAAGLAVPLPRSKPSEPTGSSLGRDIAEGVRFMLGHVVLRRLLALLVVLNGLYFGAHAVLVLYVYEILRAGNAAYAALLVATAIGAIAGQRIVGPLHRRFGSVVSITVAVWLWTIGLVVLAVATSTAAAAASLAVTGVGTGVWSVVTVSLRQTITPNRLLGRVNMAYRAVAQGVIPLGAAISGIVAARLTVRAPFVMAAAIFVLVAAITPLVLRPASAMGADGRV